MDVKTIFLYGELEEEILMKQPEGFEVKEKEILVCLIKKLLYGLKQSPRQWNKRFDEFMMCNGFKRSDFYPCVYLKRVSGCIQLLLLLYVDDICLSVKI